MKIRKEYVDLDISDYCLEGELRLKGFNNLKLLDCHNNRLTKLDASDCPGLLKFTVLIIN